MYGFTDPRARGRRSGRDDLGFGVGPGGPFRSRLEAGLHRYSNPGEDDPKRATDADNRAGSVGRSDTADYTAPAGFTGTAKPKDADEAIKGFMMDERYWKPNHPQRDAYRDAVAALWKRAYPGTYTPGPFGRGVKPSATADEILGLATSILPQQAPLTGIGRNSGAVGLRDAVAVSVKDMPQEERGGPAPKPPGIQVAHEDSENGLFTIPGLTLTGLGVDPKAVKDLGDKIDGILGNAWDAAKDAPLLGVGRYGPLGPNIRDMLGEDEQQTIDKAPPQNAPDLDTQETFPDQSDDRGFGGTLVFPDGSRYDDLSKLPPSEDQSDILPQGTILQITDDDGNEFDIDTSGVGSEEVTRLKSHLNTIPDDYVRNVVKQLTNGGKLTTDSDSRETISNISIASLKDPVATGKAAFDKVTAVGAGQLGKISQKDLENNVKAKATFPDGTSITWRDLSKSGVPTNEIHIRNTRGKVVVDLKIRYE